MRQLVDGNVIIFVNRNGLRWRDAPKDYDGPHKTLYNRWKRWGEMGVSPGWWKDWRPPVPSARP